MTIGLFCGVFLTLVTGSFDSKSETLPASDFTGSSMVLSSLIQIALLFMVYQNNLSPLTMFGAFFFEPYTLEKMLTYAVLPGAVPRSLLETLSEASETANLVLSSLTFVVLILFLIGLCRDSALLMLFSKEDNLASDDFGQEERSPVTQATACRLVAQSEGLTPRETDILYALSLGHSAKHIGDTLHISERTVQTHSLNIYRKLGVHTRQEVIDLVAHKRESADKEEI